MESGEWRVLTCPECQSLVKTPRHLRDVHVSCPKCSHSFAIPPAPTDPESVKTTLPTVRTYDPNPMALRGREKESWEAGTPELRQIDFKDRLGKTVDHLKIVDPNAPPRKRRKVTRGHRDKAKSLTAWEDNKSAPQSFSGLKRTLRNLPWGLVGLIVLILGGVIYKFATIEHTEYASTYDPPAQKAKIKVDRNSLEVQPLGEVLQDVQPVLTKFLDAQSIQEIKPLVRRPEVVHALMDKYYSQQAPFEPASYLALPVVENAIVHKNFVSLAMEDKQYAPFTVTLESTPQGYLVDWESFVGYSEMSLRDFRQAKPKTPVLMRVVLSLENYNNLDFPDGTTHQSYKLMTRERDVVIYGYTPRLSPTHEKISENLLRKELLLCVVKLQYPQNSTNDKQVEIVEFLQTGWVMREDDLANVSAPNPTSD